VGIVEELVEIWPNEVCDTADMCIQGFSGIEFGINLLADCSVQFLLHWQALHPSTYRFTSFVTPGHQKLQVTSCKGTLSEAPVTLQYSREGVLS